MEFTPEQRQAINHHEGPCLVLAVPGAGKTTVLLARLKRLIDQGIDPTRIISLTFSKKQATDMKARFMECYGHLHRPVFSTIHAFCFHVLQEQARRTNTPLALIEGSTAYNKYKVVRSLFYGIHQRPIKEEELEEFFRIDGYLKNALIDYPTYQKKMKTHFPSFAALAQAYSDFKTAHHLIDFDDMLLLTLDLLDRDADLRSALQKRCLFLQIDEAQDTSLVQLRIISLLAAPENNVFMVADDDQAIYSFRGADPQYLLAFNEAYPGAKSILMQRNYRSSKNIVRLAAGLIDRNAGRFKKTPMTDHETADKTRVILSKTLAQQTDRLVEELPTDLQQGDVAVLYRNNLSALALIDGLDRAGIPFQLHSPLKNDLDHPIINDIRDSLHLIVDPTDGEAFWRIYYKLKAYINRKDALAVRERASFSSVWDRLLEIQEHRYNEDRIEEIALAFRAMQRLKPDAALREIQGLGYGDFLKERARRNATAARPDQRLLETLETIASHCDTFPAFFARLEALKTIVANAAACDAPLILSTIHGAKGLEYDAVWMIDLMQHEFPSMMALEMAAHHAPALLEEERRLFYVGMTRARHLLRLMGRTTINGQKTAYSQFIDELARKAKKKKI